MNLRSLSITVAILIALCAVAWFARRPSAPASADPRVGAPVLAAEVASRAALVRLADQGKTVELARGADGAWRVASYHDFPADFAKLTRFVGDLTGAKIQRLVTARADRLARLEFKDTVLSLADDAGNELWRITLGKTAEGGGRFLRFGSEEKGYLADLSLWLDSEPKNWADATLVSLKADDIAGVEIGFSDDSSPSVSVTRTAKEEPWTSAGAPEGKRLRADRITTLLSNFMGLRFTDTTAPDDERAAAAREHSRTLRLTTFNGETWTIALGRKPEEKRPKPAVDVEEPVEGAAPGDSAAAKEPEMETIPAGPVFAFITRSDSAARIDEMMNKRAFQIAGWTYDGLPATPADLWEDAPPPAPAPTPADSTPAP